VRAVKGDGSLQKADRGLGLLVCEDLDVGETGGVVDADVDALVADSAASDAVAVELGQVATLVRSTDDPVPGAALDPPQLLDVDVDQLAGALLFIAADRLRGLEAAELAEADPLGAPPTRSRSPSRAAPRSRGQSDVAAAGRRSPGPDPQR